MPPRIPTIVLRDIVQPSQCYKNIYQSSRSFSSTQHNESLNRRLMWAWMNTQGEKLREPRPNSTNYLGCYDQRTGEYLAEDPESRHAHIPFPTNKHFRSDAVISEEFREVIWAKVMKDGLSVKEVSAELGVEMSRVGAVVRLKEVERAWTQAGKPLARPYAKAVMSMVPVKNYDASPYPDAHETINELPVHSATTQQIFYPTSESRVFTRKDAARVFDENLLPADKRVPHPELIEMSRDRNNGFNTEERAARAKARSDAALTKKIAAMRRRAEREAESVKNVHSGSRWNFKFTEISVDDAGPTGRGARGTGWRYGVPHMDRSRGQVKIPTRVE